MKAKDLKNSILQMAVEGKLVPQDPNDEPASVLLERIREEKHRLIAEGKAKFPKGGESIIYTASDGSPYEKRVDAKERVLSDECIVDEVPFSIPATWSWVRMETILTFVNGRAYKKSELLDHGKYRVLRVGNLFTNTSWYYSDLELDSSKYCHYGDLLYAWSASFGPTIWTGGECIFHYHIWRVEHSKLLDRAYLYWALLQDVTRVKSATTGSAMIHVSMEHMKPRLLPLPPLAEQRRIAERVAELMPLVDEYGELEDARVRLEAALPGRLRRSVLREAVQGRMVPQDPSDEPASALLARIRAERRELAAEGETKLPKGGDSVIFTGSDGRRYEKRVDARGRESEPVCIEDEIPFEIPEGWAWARLGLLCDFGKCSNVEYSSVKQGVWSLDLEDIEKDTGRIIRKKRKQADEKGSVKHTFSAGTVLYSKLRPYLNKVVLADEGGVCTSEILPLSFRGVIPKYAQIVMMSPQFVNYAKAHSYGVKMPRLGTADGSNFLLPVPPLNEQRCIVEKISEYWSFTSQ